MLNVFSDDDIAAVSFVFQLCHLFHYTLEVVEFTLNILGQRAPLGFKGSLKYRVVLRDHLVEKHFFWLLAETIGLPVVDIKLRSIADTLCVD